MGETPVSRGIGARAIAVGTENRIASLALGGIMVIPLAEIVSRKFFAAAIPGAAAYASVLTLWLGMLGAAIAAAAKRCAARKPAAYCWAVRI